MSQDRHSRIISRRTRRVLSAILTALSLSYPASHVLGHGGETHDSVQSQSQKASAPAAVGEAYRANVKPIFEKKCFDCHSQHTKYPWYHRLPVVKGLLEADVAEGLKHLDLTPDFPFHGHGSPAADLKAIGEAVTKDSMPPRLYRLMHPSSALTADEAKIVQEWVRSSQEQLNVENKDESRQ